MKLLRDDRRELLVVAVLANKFRPYLLGRPFRLRTDHGSLQWQHNFKESEGQLARWIEMLQEFDDDSYTKKVAVMAMQMPSPVFLTNQCCAWYNAHSMQDYSDTCYITCTRLRQTRISPACSYRIMTLD